jgi:broad specificity phosphatase PhoE
MPPPGLANRYFLVRAGESVYEGQGLLRTNPVAKTSVDSGLSPAGLRQAARAALELRRLGACEDDCWIWPSITQRAYQAAEIIAAANSINRRYLSHCLSVHLLALASYVS